MTPLSLLLALSLAAAAIPAALTAKAAAESMQAPPDLASLQAFVPEAGPGIAFAAEKRASAVRLAALGFGARAGLARRAWEIGAMLNRHAARLSAIYRFGDLVLREDGFTVLPPAIAETRRAFRLEPAGTRAA
ncbi:MAG: type IV secretory system conjugative DNA transfer family protein, partial [Alphaproteobacteria bacterium]|nr:type IV secretory system conjugative DNA transfer family protein [Alphaproteobacteria bacterium]